MNSTIEVDDQIFFICKWKESTKKKNTPFYVRDSKYEFLSSLLEVDQGRYIFDDKKSLYVLHDSNSGHSIKLSKSVYYSLVREAKFKVPMYNNGTL